VKVASHLGAGVAYNFSPNTTFNSSTNSNNNTFDGNSTQNESGDEQLLDQTWEIQVQADQNGNNTPGTSKNQIIFIMYSGEPKTGHVQFLNGPF
jgi:hypothetical protein